MKRLTYLFIIGIVLTSGLAGFAQTGEPGYWFLREDMPSARQEIYPSALDGKIYVVGGYTSSLVVSNTVYVYDPIARNWSTAANLPVARHHCATAVVDGILYAIGGYSNPNLPWIATNTVHAYDPGTDTWEVRASLDRARGEHSALAFDGKIYVFGGNDAFGDDLRSVEVYDPGQDSWSSVSDMPTARHHSGVAAIDSLIYVAGGRIGYWGETLTLIDVLEAYAPGSDTWYTLPSMLTPRSAFSAAAYNGRLYTFGGEIPDIYEEVEEFDPALNSWRQLTPMVTPRHGTNAAVIGDTIFVVGGADQMGAGASDANEGFVLGTCLDSDLDGYADNADTNNTCPTDNCPSAFNPGQEDADSDGVGDSCDVCVNDPLDDADGDGFCADVDNCPDVYNPGQDDFDQDGVGDSCCCDGLTGNVDDDPAGICDMGDLTALIDFLFISYVQPDCMTEANIDGAGTVDMGDLTALIDFLFITYTPPTACP
ncbi:MAG: hypothetical protein JSU65_12575 [Candidatus Zixiibacteriota bacterium]|nr:MAG: hypothetical protein JSU65_12575 [candidate division Zixibacteria bacterium]